MPRAPDDAARALARASKDASCRVIRRTTLRDGDTTWPVFELECKDNAGAIDFLDRAATLDAGHIEVRDLALRLRRGRAHDLDIARAIHAFVKVAVRFVRETRETFQHTLYTLRRRAGDCDDHARAVAALARAAGLKARIVGVPNAQGRVGHVAAQIQAAGKWWWTETTVDARFGEHPRAAATRLGLIHARPDIGAAPHSMGRTPAPPKTTLSREKDSP